LQRPSRTPLRTIAIRRVTRLRAMCAHRLSQHALADDAGLTPAVVSAIETRKANPTMASLARIAQALGVDMAVLFADRAKT
jgi:transcriptional regulator with XRE-family HTH domain